MSLQLIAISLMVLAIINCSGGKMDTTNKVILPSIKDVPAEAWQKLAQKRIYFGHQSVGYNIIDGVKDIMKENPNIKLNILETVNPSDFNAPIFGHSAIGENTNPKSKIDAFTKTMKSGVGEKVDIAFFKLCYVDIGLTSDVSKIFDNNKSAMEQLKKEYPNVSLIYVTSPLTTPPTSTMDRIKRIIKMVIGRPVANIEDNIRREEFNGLVRKEFNSEKIVFDLALIESTFPDGSRVTFEKDGKVYPVLVPAYTNDGGHLNEIGRKVVAEQFLIFLANLANK